MIVRDPILAGDHAQAFLLPHLARTEAHFREVLKEYDPDSDCQIVPAADLCFPHDVIRLAGGFATGCLVDWRCKVPIVPVDTTVNIDTTSLFWVSDDVSRAMSADRIEQIRGRLEAESSYEWNFHKGNHFISFTRRVSDGRPALVIHSNEKEFKYQYNGLMPVPGNWFMPDIRTHQKDGAYIRILAGPKAALFARIAQTLEAFNIVRHCMLASLLVDGLCQVDSETHKHHYYMPSPSTVAIGCFLCEPGETVLVFSRPGEDIHFFQPAVGGRNAVTLLNGRTLLLVPHGWGKTSLDAASFALEKDHMTLNGIRFTIEPKVTLGVHPGLVLREFSDDETSATSLFAQMRHHTPGTVLDRLRQICSYSKLGFARHH